MNNSLHGAFVTLVTFDGQRKHTVLVVCNSMSPEQALAYAEHEALRQVKLLTEEDCWLLSDAHLVDQVLISLNDCAS